MFIYFLERAINVDIYNHIVVYFMKDNIMATRLLHSEQN